MTDLLYIDSFLPRENDEKLLDILLYGNSKFSTITNQNILICTLEFIKDSHRCDNLSFSGICIPVELFSILLLLWIIYDNLPSYVVVANIFSIY